LKRTVIIDVDWHLVSGMSWLAKNDLVASRPSFERIVAAVRTCLKEAKQRFAEGAISISCRICSGGNGRL
jgi:hypothetical protein